MLHSRVNVGNSTASWMFQMVIQVRFPQKAAYTVSKKGFKGVNSVKKVFVSSHKIRGEESRGHECRAETLQLSTVSNVPISASLVGSSDTASSLDRKLLMALNA